MVNEVRGEREITLGSKTFVVALTFKTLAALQSAFRVKCFEDAFAQIGEWLPIEGEDKAMFRPDAEKLLLFWTTILDANGFNGQEIADEAINPYSSGFAAFDLLEAVRQLWGATRSESSSSPLAPATAGKTG